MGGWSKPFPQSDVWGKPCSGLDLAADELIARMTPILVEESLNFMVEYDHDDGRVEILRSNFLSLVDAPLVGPDIVVTAILMAMEDGSLGFAHVDMFTLYQWSRQMNSNTVVSWSQHTVIHLKNLLSIQNSEERLRPIGSIEVSDSVFMTTYLGIYDINVKL